MVIMFKINVHIRKIALPVIDFTKEKKEEIGSANRSRTKVSPVTLNGKTAD